MYHPTLSPRHDARRGRLFVIERAVCRQIVRRFLESSREFRGHVRTNSREGVDARAVRVTQTINGFGEMVGCRNHMSRSPRRRGRLLRVGDLPGFTGERRRLEFTAARRRSKVS